MTAATAKPPKPQPGALVRYIPILGWLPNYNRAWLVADIVAGLTLWGMVVPEGIAYAGIAGLPPQAGLYTLLASLLIYALLGSSRHLVVQATSATAALLASAIAAALIATSAEAAADPETYQAYASAFVLVVGVVFVAAGLARIGFVTQFLSKPVMDGFVMGLAAFVAVGQLNKLFGVPKPEGNTVDKLIGIIRELPNANWAAFAVGAAALVLLFMLPLWNKKLPAGLVVLFGAIGLSTLLGLSERFGVAVVGALPQGLPTLTVPRVPFATWLAMLLPAIGVVLVAYSEALGVAREFAEKHGYEVDPNQELNAQGVANLASALFGGMIAGGSMSASAVKEGAGAQSQVANLVSWVVTIVTVLFLTPLFTSLPESVLAALIIHAVWHIIASRKLQKTRLLSRSEFWLGATAFMGVILVDVLQGMVIGLLCSLILVIAKSSRPHLASLGRVPGIAGAYADLTRHTDITAVPGLLILRLDAPLFFANALSMRDAAKREVEEASPAARAVIFDLSFQEELDITSGEMLDALVKDLQGAQIAVYASNMHAPVAAFCRKIGLLDRLGEQNVFLTTDLAVSHFESLGQESGTAPSMAGEQKPEGEPKPEGDTAA